MVTLPVEKIKKPIVTSWRDLQTVVVDGTSKGWGKFVEILEKRIVLVWATNHQRLL